MRITRRVIVLAAGAICLSVAAAASAAASTGAGAVAPARAAAQGMTTPVGPPGAGDASAIGAARPAGSWGRAIEVPGLGALNKRGPARVSSVSCASAGSCSAGGSYTDRRGLGQGFVVSERHGRWGKAIEVPGLGALNTSGDATVPAEVSEVSCASAGNCAAGGYYADRGGDQHGFVVSQRRGRWGKAIEMPRAGVLNAGADAHVDSVSCAPAGGCAAGGNYQDRRGNLQGFVAVERNGAWGKPIEVPGLGALNKGGFAEVTSVSCASAGNCAAGGDYTDRRGGTQGFVAVERHGVWRRAIEVPGLGALNVSDLFGAYVYSVSCASAGNCTAGGFYSDRSTNQQGFVAVLRNGRWGTAIEVPGLGALNKGGFAFVFSVSCAPAGTCAAGGNYLVRRGHYQGFVVSRTG